MAKIIEFPQRPDSLKAIQNELSLDQAEELAIKSVSTLLEQALRTQSAVAAYQAEIESEYKLKS